MFKVGDKVKLTDEFFVSDSSGNCQVYEKAKTSYKGEIGTISHVNLYYWVKFNFESEEMNALLAYPDFEFLLLGENDMKKV